MCLLPVARLPYDHGTSYIAGSLDTRGDNDMLINVKVRIGQSTLEAKSFTARSVEVKLSEHVLDRDDLLAICAALAGVAKMLPE